MVSQFALAFVGGSGLTGVVTTFYEFHVRSKEQARQYFHTLVLKSELFESLANLMELYELLPVWQTFKKTGSVVVTVNEKLISTQSEGQLQQYIEGMVVRANSTVRKMRLSGVFFLMPASVRTTYENLITGLPGDPSTVDERTLVQYKNESWNYQTVSRKPSEWKNSLRS
ncbi:MAG: hypothetical protein ACLPY5_00085 [Candidatus Bathyarchaeia archaeon]